MNVDVLIELNNYSYNINRNLLMGKYDVFHYTKRKGLYGITNNLANNSNLIFRHTRYDCFEDIKEGEIIDSIYQKVLNELKNSNEINNEFYMMAMNIHSNFERSLVVTLVDGNYLLKTNVPCTPYVCCFCENGNSEYMVNHYTGDCVSGYSLKLNFLELEECCNAYFGNGYKHVFLNEIYKQDEQKQIIKNFLIKLYKSELEIKSINFYIQNLLNDLQFAFKDETFEDEKEIRSVIYIPNNLEIMKNKDSNSCISFSKNNGNYIEYNFGSEVRLFETRIYEKKSINITIEEQKMIKNINSSLNPKVISLNDLK